MYPDESNTRTPVQSAVQGAVQSGLYRLTLDGLSALAGPRGAVLVEPDGDHTIVRDIADLDPHGWVP